MQKNLYIVVALLTSVLFSFKTFALDIEEGGLEKRQKMKKEIIQERQNFEKCEDLDCYNATANRVIEKFYHFPDLDKKAYDTFVHSTIDAYEVINCLAELDGPAGSFCSIESQYDAWPVIHEYVHKLIEHVEKQLQYY